MKNKILYTIPFIILLIFTILLSFAKEHQMKVDFINFSKEEVAKITLTSRDNKALISKSNQIARILDILSPTKKTRNVSNVSPSSKTELSITLTNREPAIFYLYENNNLFYIEYENVTYAMEKEVYQELISYVNEVLTLENKEFLEENFEELEDFYVQVTKDFDPITDLKSTYYVDQAIYDGCYVYALKEYNRDKLNDFIESAKNKSTSFIREV